MALDDVFAGVERICDKYRSYSSRDVAARWKTIEQDGQVKHIRKILSERYNYATGLLEGLMDELVFSFAGISGLNLNPSQDMREIVFYCDNEYHPRKKLNTIASALVSADNLDLQEMIMEPRDFMYTVYDLQMERFYSLKEILKNGKVKCPHCKTPATKIITGSARVFVDADKEEGLIKEVEKALRREKLGRGALRIEEQLELLLHPNFRYQTFNQLSSETTPLSVLLNNHVGGRAKQYAMVKDIIVEKGSPSVVAQGRMKFRRLAAKYMLTKYIETDRDFLDILGLRFKFPFVGNCYTMVNGVLPNLNSLKMDSRDIEDYISKPKTTTGYKALHTLASILPQVIYSFPNQMSLDGEFGLDVDELAPFFDWKCLEIQTRTFEMDLNAMGDNYHQSASVRSRLKSERLRAKYVIISKLLDPRKVGPHLIG